MYTQAHTLWAFLVGNFHWLRVMVVSGGLNDLVRDLRIYCLVGTSLPWPRS